MKKCGKCQKSGEFLSCSRCGLEHYCSQNCQKEHWKEHKTSCRPVLQVQIENKGYGLVATRNIKEGELILSEMPVLILSKNEKDRTSRNLEIQFQKLSKNVQKKILSLHDENREGEEERKLARIFFSNAIDVNSEKSAALYLTIPRINHSCSPNVVWGYGPNSPLSKEVRALKEIKKGSELEANYIDSWEASFRDHSRRQDLLQRWSFTCSCKICSLPNQLLEEDDKYRKMIMIQHSLVPKYMERWNVRKALEAAKTKLNLSLQIKDDILTSLPSTYLEVYEMIRIAEVLGEKVEPGSPYLEKARKLSTRFGFSFLQSFNSKGYI
ncbi:N-lysine methyltransferase SMYD2 [Eurytemora carolleeae]|uniref:N-lysine methyltransferase SMYD2 n=1 Tax=Eurytemora carolleeae TaxID=1294199 RepID=UPI000C77A0CC|nr:N-lysine methyltransferase SMYD2 [Eurytemora carolleeae]|eukprot:XP_023323657.1 N-lysine methyltransferase SMYD2-like [Eurytemora affinis]